MYMLAIVAVFQIIQGYVVDSTAYIVWVTIENIKIILIE